MLMWIFSSWDALSAESLGHKKVDFSWSPGKRVKADGDDRKVTLVKGKSGNPTTEPPTDDKSKKLNGAQNWSRSRFALELDGVHCFETIELGRGQRVAATKRGFKAREKVNNSKIPKLAPQFDGLYSFETLVY